MKELLEKPLPQIPDDIRKKLESPRITPTSFVDRESILYDPSLQQEVGYICLPDGNWLVSMVCPMSDITPEMVNWWFWWHCQENLRYQVWFPGEHYSISYKKQDREYFQQKTMPPFQPTSQRPVERVGKIKLPLQIDFVTPETFGFSKEGMENNHIPVILCGHVSAFNGIIKHTEMAHIFRQTPDGLFMISRFWIGATLKNPLLRKILLTEDTARGMAEHCCVEYRNLTEILPGLYQKYHC